MCLQQDVQRKTSSNSKIKTQLLLESIRSVVQVTLGSNCTHCVGSSVAAGQQTLNLITVRGRQDLKIQGPRLNLTKEDKMQVRHSTDRRLDPIITPPMPLMEVGLALNTLLCYRTRCYSETVKTGCFWWSSKTCVCLRSSSCSSPLLCCVVRSEKPTWSSVMSVLFLCVVSAWRQPTRTSSPLAAGPRHPPLQSRPRTAQPIKPLPQTFRWVQKPQRFWSQQRSLVSHWGW